MGKLKMKNYALDNKHNLESPEKKARHIECAHENFTKKGLGESSKTFF